MAAILCGVLFGAFVIAFLGWGSTGLRQAYNNDVTRELGRRIPTLTSVTDADLMRLPSPVQRYLRAAGVVGQPRVANMRLRMHGRIRSGPDARWMPLRAEQHNFFDSRKRFFYLTSSMFGVAVQGYHRYADSAASMHIKAAGIVTVARLAGEEMFQSETVTLLNDMCLFAPATLLDPALAWEEVDARTARVRFTNAARTVRAELAFNDTGELIDFVSEDRYQASTDRKRMTKLDWSTPVTEYRAFGPIRLGAIAEARWHTPDGSYAYIELELDDVAYNVRSH
jgi:hypothetical protein